MDDDTREVVSPSLALSERILDAVRSFNQSNRPLAQRRFDPLLIDAMEAVALYMEAVLKDDKTVKEENELLSKARNAVETLEKEVGCEGDSEHNHP